MARHGRLNMKARLGSLADFADQRIDRLPCHQSSLSEKEIGRVGIAGVVALAQPGAPRPQLIPFGGLLR